MDFMNKATKTLAILFNNLTSSLEPLKETLTGLFENPKQALIDFGNLIKDRIVVMVENFFGLFVNGFAVLNNLIKGAGFALAGIFDDEAAAKADVYFEKAGESAKEFGKNVMVVSNMDLVVKAVVKTAEVVGELGDQLDEAATASDAFVKKEKELKLAEAELGKFIAGNRLELEQLKGVREDETKTIEERIAASDRMMELIQEEEDRSIALQEQKIALMKADLDLTNTTTEDLVAIANAEAELDNLRAGAAVRNTENMKFANTLRKQEADKLLEEKQTQIDKEKELEKEKQDYIRGLEEATLEDQLEKIDEEKDRLDQLYLDGEISYEAHLIRMQELDDKYADLTKESEVEAVTFFTEEQRKKFKAYAKGLEQAQQLVSAFSNFQNALMENELAAAGDNEQEKDAIRKKYAEKKKATMLLEAVIGTALAVINGLNTTPFLPVGIAMAIAAGVTGAVQIATIAGTSFADGGILDGPSHAQGGIQTGFGELEGGEGVINAGSMSNASLRNLASAANTGGGGKDFSSGDGSIKLDGGSISAIVGGINNKKVYLTETDMTETQEQVAVMEEEATI